MPVSIRDVAARANVSVGTVSKALNDTASRIPPATREHIRRVAQEIGYQPNRFAKSLGKGRTDTIGLMVSGLQNPFFASLAEACESALLATGYQVFLDAAPSWGGTYATHNKLRGWPVDGALIWALPKEHLADYLGEAAHEIPVVYMGYPRPEGVSVSFDLYKGGEIVTEHLIERGYAARGLVHVSPHAAPNRTEHNLRLHAFVHICTSRNIKHEVLVLPEFAETREAGYGIGEQLARRAPSERPGAVFCHNDVVAVGVHRALRRAGLRVPEDIAIAGFDAIPEAKFLESPLTTVATPPDELAQIAVRHLLRQLRLPKISVEDGLSVPADSQTEQIILMPRLVVGGTT